MLAASLPRLQVASCPAHIGVGTANLWNAAEQEFLKAVLWERQAESRQLIK